MAKKSIGAVLTLKDNDFQAKMRQANKNWDQFQNQAKLAKMEMGGFERAILKGMSNTTLFGRRLDGAALAIAKTTNRLKGLNGTNARPTISVRDNSGSVISNIGNKLTSLKALAAGIIIGGIGAKATEATLGGAMNLETSSLTLQALMGDAKKANQLFDAMNKKGQMSAFSEKDFLTGAQSFLPMTKSLNQLNRLAGIQERLAMSNKNEGMEGAAFSIREALSGDTMSLAERFNMPKSMLRDVFDGTTTIEQRIVALDKVLTQMGFTQKFVTDVNKSAASQWDNLKSNITMALAKMGTSGLDKIKGPLEKINKLFSNQRFMDKIISKGGTYIADFLDGGIKAVEKSFKFIQTHYLDNQKFRNLSFTGKVNFVLDDVAKYFQSWLDSGGGDRVRAFGADVGTFIGEGVISVMPTLFETAGKMAVSAFADGLKSSPIGAVIMGGLAGAGTGAAIGALGGPIGVGGGALIGGAAGLITHGMTYDTGPVIQKNTKTTNDILHDIDKDIKNIGPASSNSASNIGFKVSSRGGTNSMANFRQMDVGHNALGSAFWRGGLTWLGERGPELVDLPQGSKVYSNEQSMSMVNDAARSKSTGDTYIDRLFDKLADQVIIREEADVDKVMTRFVSKLKDADINFGGAG